VRLADEKYDFVSVDPAPPVESAGSVVLYTREFLEQGKEVLKPGGVFLLWLPHGTPMADYKAHVRTFDAEFEHVKVMLSPAGHGTYMLGSEEPLEVADENVEAVLGRPEVLEDLALAPDYERLAERWELEDIDGTAWSEILHYSEWLEGEEVAAFTGDGPMITDDRPLSEYFLWRRAFLDDKAYINEPTLRAATE
jgi:hypothetical protein